MKYTVHLYVTVRVPQTITADSPEGAVEKAATEFFAAPDRNIRLNGSYADDFQEKALVDELDDNSRVIGSTEVALA